jgi:putative SOS response-associated peptidase YedK
MCRRFTLSANTVSLTESFPDFELPDQLTARYNITPSQEVAVVANNNPGKIEFFRWGLIPSWAKDPTIGNRMINARSEILSQKPSFRTAYIRKKPDTYDRIGHIVQLESPLYLGSLQNAYDFIFNSALPIK